MKKNVAGQVVVAQLINKTDGSAVTSGTTSVYLTGDGGVQILVTTGSPEAQHLGNGVWGFYPSAGETNYDHVAFTFVNSLAVNATIQVWPSYPQTGDNYARLGAPAGASVSADVAAVKAVLPAALVSGRIDASVGAMAADTLTSSALAASAVSEIQSGLSTLDATAVRSAVGLASANLDTQIGTLATSSALSTVAGYVDTEVAAIKAKTDNLPASPAATSDIPSASANASAVWAYIVENSTSALSFMRGFAATLLGKASGMGTTTAIFRDTADSKNRVTATVDADGNRTAVTTDFT